MFHRAEFTHPPPLPQPQHRAIGRLVDQPIREAGRWGLLPPGATVNALAPLFPRVEQSA